MSSAAKTPGVYIVEKNARTADVVQVATAVPAFVGYTQRADAGGNSLTGKALRIASMAEFEQHFGAQPDWRFTLDRYQTASIGAALPERVVSSGVPAAAAYTVSQVSGAAGGQHLLYLAMRHFFQNGGGPCYVVSVGDYEKDVESSDLEEGIRALEAEQEPTLLVIPDAVRLSDAASCYSLYAQALEHCGGRMCNRMAILDVFGGARPVRECIEEFREKVVSAYLSYGAAYYPWLNTALVGDDELGLARFADRASLVAALRADLESTGSTTPGDRQAAPIELLDQLATIDPKVATPAELDRLHKAVAASSKLYRSITAEIKRQLNIMPPSAAMAGLYCLTDNSRGVWKAPANLDISAAISPAVGLSDNDQEDLNLSPQGKSINAIRLFAIQGVLVWGARTLDGNNLDWRYINVRRTMLMLEQSIKLAVMALVFEPNVTGTWITIKSMIANFLTGIWQQGGLMGAVAADAFSVNVGLGETMTEADISAGVLRVTVRVAVVRLAEYIEITFQQQMRPA